VKILFGFTSSQLGHSPVWDYPETNPLGGAETAVLKVASVFRDAGHEVELINYYDPARTVEYRQLMAGKHCDLFINSRLPEPILALQTPPGKLNYYWAHDDANQPLLKSLADKPEWRRAFYTRLDGLFFLSRYQRTAWISQLGLVLEKTHLITNPISYDKFEPEIANLRARGARAYYASTPYRGLKYLLQAWPSVRRSVPDAEVEVFSSLEVNGLPETEANQALYTQAMNTPGVIYRGAVSQKVLREAAQRARVLAYPCCFPETSCIVAMEAMAAGAVVVGTELGALPETAWKNPMQPITHGWLDRWIVDVERVLVNNDYYEDLAQQNIALARHYDAKVVARRMSQVFRADLAGIGVRVDAQLSRGATLAV
jgi:glycosyltransferase involved in cell wall biosynthesis